MKKYIQFTLLISFLSLSIGCLTESDIREIKLPDKLYKFDRKVRDWKYIVIHHSASSTGNASSFNKYHRKKFRTGLAYHFVITNGRGGTDGRIETGFRWKKQYNGTHVKRSQNHYNDKGIGICIVGNADENIISPKQQIALVLLVQTLRKKYNIPWYHVLSHREVPFNNSKHHTSVTNCPGWRISMDRFRRLIFYLDKEIPLGKQFNTIDLYKKIQVWEDENIARTPWP